jgi:hypothetical protein
MAVGPFSITPSQAENLVSIMKDGGANCHIDKGMVLSHMKRVGERTEVTPYDFANPDDFYCSITGKPEKKIQLAGEKGGTVLDRQTLEVILVTEEFGVITMIYEDNNRSGSAGARDRIKDVLVSQIFLPKLRQYLNQ